MKSYSGLTAMKCKHCGCTFMYFDTEYNGDVVFSCMQCATDHNKNGTQISRLGLVAVTSSKNGSSQLLR